MAERPSTNRRAFEPDFLADRSRDGLLRELHRVASITGGTRLTQKMFRQHAKVSVDLIRREFGGWAEALQVAGLTERYVGVVVTDKMRKQPGRSATDEELVAALREVAQRLGKSTITVAEFADGSHYSAAVLRSRFGSWKQALQRAGLSSTRSGTRYEEAECFENLAAVWTHYGRQPQYLEMGKAPSRVGSKAYISKWGTWRKAVLAFAEWARRDDPVGNAADASQHRQPAALSRPALRSDRDTRAVPDRLRFKVLTRDGFRCVACGRSPATHQGIVLCADHVIPWASGGRTEISNLQTLCGQCNIGKGDWVP